MPSNNLNEKIMGLVVTTLAAHKFRAEPAFDKDQTVFGWNVARVYTNPIERAVHSLDHPVAFIAMDDEDTADISRYPESPSDIEEMIKVLEAALQTNFGFDVKHSFWKAE